MLDITIEHGVAGDLIPQNVAAARSTSAPLARRWDAAKSLKSFGLYSGAGWHFHAFQPLDFSIVQDYKMLVAGIAKLSVKPIEVRIAVLNQKRGVQVPLDTPAVRHLVPALGEFLLVIAVVKVVILAGLGLPGLDILEVAAGSYHFVFQDIDKSGGRLVGDAFTETLPAQVLASLRLLHFF